MQDRIQRNKASCDIVKFLAHQYPELPGEDVLLVLMTTLIAFIESSSLTRHEKIYILKGVSDGLMRYEPHLTDDEITLQ